MPKPYEYGAAPSHLSKQVKVRKSDNAIYTFKNKDIEWSELFIKALIFLNNTLTKKVPKTVF